MDRWVPVVADVESQFEETFRTRASSDRENLIGIGAPCRLRVTRLGKTRRLEVVDYLGESHARSREIEQLKTVFIRGALEVVPDLSVGVVLVHEGVREWLPGLGVDRCIVNDPRFTRPIFPVPGVPFRIHRSPEVACRGLDRLPSTSVACQLDVPGGIHLRAVDQHHRCVSGCDRKEPMLVHVGIEQIRGVGEIHLVDVVVDRFALTAGERRNRESVIREPGQPHSAVEPREVLHQVNLVAPGSVANLLDRPDEDSLGSLLSRFGADEDPHGIFPARLDARLGIEDHALGTFAQEQRVFAAASRQQSGDDSARRHEAHRDSSVRSRPREIVRNPSGFRQGNPFLQAFSRPGHFVSQERFAVTGQTRAIVGPRDPSIFESVDAVRGLQYRGLVGDHEQRHLSTQAAHGLADCRLALLVERSRRLVQNQNAW